jgi:phenylacetate-CoA ligase
MSLAQEKIYKRMPFWIKNALVTIYDRTQYKKRHSGSYKAWMEYHKKARNFSLAQLQEEQSVQLFEFLNFAKDNSPYYKELFGSLGIEKFTSLEDFYKIPIQSKEDIRKNIDQIYTITEKESIVGRTGGTTGKSLEVRYTYDDMQNRFAVLDLFRANWGYKLGEKVAWFSGKTLLSEIDTKKKRYWRYDWLYKIRYYSTFHITDNTALYYINDLNKFKPLYAVGFPSCMVEIAKWGIKNGHQLNYKMKAVFPTSETLLDEHVQLIKAFFGGSVVNQYASSEGAPFILESEKGKLHMMLLTGYWEILDQNGQHANEGELVFTSFTTHGTPLIRYAIKDKLKLAGEADQDDTDHNPVVTSLEGRINDYVYSVERGKINPVNVANSVKYVRGIIKFQIVQDSVDKILVRVVKDVNYTDTDEKMFLHELTERLGNNIQIDFSYDEDIPREASGKYRIIKSTLSI